MEREEKRRAAILEAARRLFQRYGYKKTTMEEIAAEAGITKPTVYSYFKGKRDILVSLIEWEASRILETGLANVDEKAGAIEQLMSIFNAVDDFLKEDTFLQGIVSRDPDILTPEVLRVALDFEHRIIGELTKILERGMEDGVLRNTDPKLMAYTMVRLHEAFTFSSFFDLEGYKPPKTNEFLLEMMVAALRPVDLPRV